MIYILRSIYYLFDVVWVLGSFRIQASFDDICFAHLMTTLVEGFGLEGWCLLKSLSSTRTPQNADFGTPNSTVLDMPNST